MTDHQLTSLTLSEAAGLIASREVSPVEITQAHLNRIETIDLQLNSFITLTGEQALRQAQGVEESLQKGIRLGPLQGLPLALKDLFETRGVRTTAGSKFFADHISEHDASVVEKLRSSGAVLLGKLNMHEIALGVTNENPHYGDCNNPWDTKRVSGGSSGGSAAAVAGELCLGALGSDTGGSIRIPASLCGVVGLKPTFGRVSKRGVIPLSWNLDHVGPMTRCVKDVAILLGVLAGYDPEDSYSRDVPVDDYLVQLDGGVRGWRVAFAQDEFFTRADPVVLAAVGAAAGIFEDLGATVTELEISFARQAAQANGLMTTSDAAVFHRERLRNHPELFGPDVLARLETGAGASLEDYVLARHTQTLTIREFEDLFERYDILLTPTTPFAAPERGSEDAVKRARQLTRFTAPFNLTGLPALSLPCGFTTEGLPIGLQIVTRPWGERLVLRAARAYEGATEWHLRRPSL
jgi:aspartyl-tRNA(Asn)/glutamyl-tRNA(Gln) amidotransferase subunit A